MIHRPHIASGDCGKWLGISVPADIIGTKTGDYPLERIHREPGRHIWQISFGTCLRHIMLLMKRELNL